MRLIPIDCPACESGAYALLGTPLCDEIFSDKRVEISSNVRVVECSQCGLIYVRPMPEFDKVLLNRMYREGFFPQSTQRWTTIRTVLNPRRRFALAQRFVARPIKRYLEVGCGEGFALEQAVKAGYEAYAQDISENFAESAKRRTGIEIDTQPVSRESYPCGTFDLIYMDSIAEHVQNPKGFLEVIAGFLAPGGVLYLIVPNEKSLMNHLKNTAFRLMGKPYTAMISPFKNPYHLVGYSRKSMRFLAHALSLRVVSLTCDKSYLHIDQVVYTGFKAKLPYRLLRKIGGLVYLFSDIIGMGSNLEAICIKPDA
jgi:2-polyprenyl-3-methyl-5-hydroxy-6-metoxy-1,4-benzoquinol methylase